MRDERWFNPWWFVVVFRDGKWVTIVFPFDRPETVVAGEDLRIAQDHIRKVAAVRELIGDER